MLRAKLFAVVAAGLSAAACSYNSTTTAAIPSGPGPVYVATAAGEACVDYGFPPGSVGYGRCVQREQEARALGRMPRDYAEARLMTDARDACSSYGLQPGTGSYDRCVGREVDSRRWRADQAYVVPGGVVYTQPAVAEYVPPAPPPPPAGVLAFKDEFGFRYDGQGNRLDAHGNIISPQSTRP
jgi:hypothetical protein